MKISKIRIASDHAGFERKKQVISFLQSYHPSIEVVDFGTQSESLSVDFPDYADLVSRDLKNDSEVSPLEHFGILICGSGQGMAMRANKFPWVRAALCWSAEVAKLSREHNNANVLCLGARLIDEKLTFEILETFLSTPFAGGRHQARVVKIGQSL